MEEKCCVVFFYSLWEGVLQATSWQCHVCALSPRVHNWGLNHSFPVHMHEAWPEDGQQHVFGSVTALCFVIFHTQPQTHTLCHYVPSDDVSWCNHASNT